MTNLILLPDIEKRIYTLRGFQVMLDRDLAELYGVKPIRLREQVKRNSSRFPDDFMFQLSESEVDFMVSQNAIPLRKTLGGTLPYVFTEQGVASVSGVLSSERAIEMNIAIMRAFVTMRQFLSNNASVFQRLEQVEKRQIANELKTVQRFEQLFDALEDKSIKPKQGLLFDGQVFDAHVFVNDLIRSAKQRIILIDNYVDDSVLTLLSKRNKIVSAEIVTKAISATLAQSIEKHNQQYPAITVQTFQLAHDRFLMIDNTLYHIGASLKDLGKKWFAFSKMKMCAIEMLARVKV